MRTIAKTMLAASVAAAALIAVPAGAATYTYVGSWYVGEGPVWTSNPAVLNGVETAALLFGGSASDYAISTVDNSVANINFQAHVDGWGDDTFLFSTVSQSYKLDSGDPGYNDPFGGPSYSAYVLDHSCFNRYSDPSQGCGVGEPGLNFAFRIDAVPEPATWALMILGFGAVGGAIRRRTKVAVRFA